MKIQNKSGYIMTGTTEMKRVIIDINKSDTLGKMNRYLEIHKVL